MIDLTARFALDVDKTREWLTQIITGTYPPPTCILTGEAGENPDDCTTHDHEGSAAVAELDLAEDWSTETPGSEWTAERLIQAAMDDEIIGCPDEMEVYFDFDDREDGGYYRFLVDIGADVATMVRLATLGWEIRKLGNRKARGADAALAVLSEAVVSANGALDNLAALAAA